jgi:hypothetical protein
MMKGTVICKVESAKESPKIDTFASTGKHHQIEQELGGFIRVG